MKTYLFTGGTGYFGSVFAVKLLKDGHNLIFIGRSKEKEPYKERILKKLEKLDKNIDQKLIKTIEVDLSDKIDLKKIPNEKIDGIWHFAAMLNFKKEDRKKTFLINIKGTENIIKLANKFDCPIFYISTAYVHGKTSGIFYEKIYDITKFNNPYEESKYISERKVFEWGLKNHNKFAIFRPSILVGGNMMDSNFFGYYAVLYSFYKLRKTILKIRKGKVSLPLIWLSSNKSNLNLIDLNIASDFIYKIYKSNDFLGKIFHITNPNPPNIKTVLDQSMRALDIKIKIIDVNPIVSKIFTNFMIFVLYLLNPITKLSKVIRYYKYYMTEYNKYDMSNTKKTVGEISETDENFVYNLAKDFIKKFEEKKKIYYEN